MRGETTKQMLEAPQGAVYVWATGDLAYPKSLAQHLGRTDLIVVTPNWLEHAKGNTKPIVVDHAAQFTGYRADCLHRLLNRGLK